MEENTRLATRLIHHPGGFCEYTGAVNVPIYEVSTFRQEGVGQNKGYDYSRSSNPTRKVLENYIADLEKGQFGFAFSSGMAAISACIMLLKSGEHLIVTEGLYGGTHRVLTQVFHDYGVSYSFVDTGDLEAVTSAFRQNTRAILLETPSNPLMRISDIRNIASLAHKNEAIVIVDNTFMSSWFQRPLELGADIVVHSATKSLSGHSDVIIGLVATADPTLASRLKLLQNAVGSVPSPFDCWLLMRGMKTLGVRLSHAQRSAEKIAEWLSGHKQIEQILYPGLNTFTGYQLHHQQADGSGTILSLRLRDGTSPETLLSNLSLWTLAVSLGAVESIITQPSRMTHLSYPQEERERLGLRDNLIRLSVGIEAVEDLITDFELALERAS